MTPYSRSRSPLAAGDPINAIAATTDEFVVIAGGNPPGSIYTMDLLQTPPHANLLGRQIDGTSTLRISSDRKWLVSLGSEFLYVWDLKERKLKWHRAGDGVNCLTLDVHTEAIICGLSDGRVLEMSLTEGEIGRTIAVHAAPIRSLALCPQNRRVASVDEYERIMVSDLQSCTSLWSTTYTSSNVTLFSPDGKILITSPLPRPYTKVPPPILELRDADTGHLLGNLTGHSKTILGAAFAKDSLLYSWGMDGTVRAWNVEQGKLVKVVIPALQSKFD